MLLKAYFNTSSKGDIFQDCNSLPANKEMLACLAKKFNPD